MSNERDEAIEAVRRAFCDLQRYSFLKDNDGNVRRTSDKSGNWIDWSQAHDLFDPMVVDALVAKEKARAYDIRARSNT